jgi:nitrite reductase/ring-hydroxylating ferredoxin subunit
MTRLEMESVNCSLISIDELIDSKPMACNALIDNNNVPIIVLRYEGVLHVYQNQCPHQGRRLDYAPGQFLSNNGLMVCAAHGASFALDTGLCTQGPCRGESLFEYDYEFFPEKNAIRVFLKNG